MCDNLLGLPFALATTCKRFVAVGLREVPVALVARRWARELCEQGGAIMRSDKWSALAERVGDPYGTSLRHRLARFFP